MTLFSNIFMKRPSDIDRQTGREWVRYCFSAKAADDTESNVAALYITEKLVQSSSPDFADTDSKLFNSIILARPLPEDATIATLKHLFPGATDIAFPRQVLGARYVLTWS